MSTQTLKDQNEVERICQSIYKDETGIPELNKLEHLRFVSSLFEGPLPRSMTKLDASQSWLIYWTTNSALLLGATLEPEEQRQIAEKVIALQYPTGGIGGGPGQLSHIASSYSALMALTYVDDQKYLEQINKAAFYDWLINVLKNADGSFKMHLNGETDIRAVYCALCCASVLGILTPELTKNTAEWISSCQTYEGGFGGVPNNEAHGGYTFCGVAALCLLGNPKEMLTKYCNLDSLVNWAVNRQMQIEGGFQGRDNKLVDGCYSHWVGGIFSFLEAATGKTLYSRQKLRKYILGCCQYKFGGLIDKPGKRADFYHTNYNLLGLSHCQHSYSFNREKFQSGVPAAFCYESKLLKDFAASSTVQASDPVFGCVSGMAERLYKGFKDIQ